MQASNANGLQRSHAGGLARLELAKPPRNLLDPDVMRAWARPSSKPTPTPISAPS